MAGNCRNVFKPAVDRIILGHSHALYGAALVQQQPQRPQSPPSGDDFELGSLRGLAGQKVMDEAMGLDAGGQFGPTCGRDSDNSGIHGLARVDFRD
ncbi:hypothetical protein X740_17265 [Mesorhizobium sp. LNHC221B00]|nr:hypothetical protein X740_17265 [Mesorhizobium sp. LNHC221B00]